MACAHDVACCASHPATQPSHPPTHAHTHIRLQGKKKKKGTPMPIELHGDKRGAPRRAPALDGGFNLGEAQVRGQRAGEGWGDPGLPRQPPAAQHTRPRTRAACTPLNPRSLRPARGSGRMGRAAAPPLATLAPTCLIFLGLKRLPARPGRRRGRRRARGTGAQTHCSRRCARSTRVCGWVGGWVFQWVIGWVGACRGGACRRVALRSQSADRGPPPPPSDPPPTPSLPPAPQTTRPGAWWCWWRTWISGG